MHNVGYFNTRFSHTKARQRLWPVLVEHLQRRFIPEDAVILDVGAGYCDFVNHVRAKEKHALDIAPILLDHASSEVITHVGPASDLKDFNEEYFDIVFASNLFEHLHREEFLLALKEIRRVLKQKGKLIVIQPNFRICPKIYFDDYTHVQIFTDRSLADVLSSFGLTPVHVEPRFLPFSTQSYLPASTLLLTVYLRLPLRPFAGQMLLVAEKS